MQCSINFGLFKLPPSLWLLLILIFLTPAPAAAQVSTEYQAKAVFLFRFAEFVEWPPDAFATPQSPIILGVLGTNPFGNALPQAVHGETISGRSLIVKQFQNIQESGPCQVMFISRSEAAQWPAILSALDGRSILTVSEDERFLAKGGMIQFITEEHRVRFKINQKAAEAAKLKLSSKLLQLAR